MSIYSNVTEQDFNNLRKLAEQQKNQRALKIKNRILKQTHDVNLEESLSPITKKLEEVKETTEKIRDVIKESPQFLENIKHILRNSQSQTSKLVSATDELVKTFSKMNDTTTFFKVLRNAEGKFLWGGTEINPFGGNRIEIDGEKYNLTPGDSKSFH